MQCTKPITLFQVGKEYYPLGLQLPCGKCLSCRIKKRSEWSMRMLHELSYHENSCFLTLTYNELNEPENGSLKIRDLQLFFKRLRKALEPRKIKYFACGEYGEDTQRPHYHAIVFGLSLTPADKNIVIDCWKKCSWEVYSIKKNSFGIAEPDSIQYVAQYIEKKLSGDEATKQYTDTGREPVFRILSNGLGKQFCLDNSDQIKTNGFLTLKGSKVSIPRYYINKLDIDTETLKGFALDKQSDEVQKIAGVYLTPDELYMLGTSDENFVYLKSTKAKKIQTDKNLHAKIMLSERNLGTN